ncbi:winged helix-turn-helix domain-containing protein [Paraburkholderia sp. D1E]|uniref:winged helix-turn-helix domain-containing protein n=1 Tax=Paraburkholderia sp. D1E TaxID=3461398 RepID=UPI004045738E
MTISLLVVEPDQSVRDQLRFHLHKNQITLSVLYSAAQLVSRVELECPSAILLRAESPMAEAREALRQLRLGGYDMPIFVQSTSDEIVDKIVAFELGADDYIVDPVDPYELTARIKRAVQRNNRALCDAPEIREKVSFGSYQIDFATRRLVKDGCEISLRSGEFALLKLFASNPMRILTRSMVNSQLGRAESQKASLDVAVCRLRGVIEADPSAPRFIQTLRGRGYMFVPSPESSSMHGARENASVAGHREFGERSIEAV